MKLIIDFKYIFIRNMDLKVKVNLINNYKNNMKLILINQKNQIINNIKKLDLNIIIFY